LTDDRIFVKKKQTYWIICPKGGYFTVSISTHSVWSILPWEVPWDWGHGFFLGLAYLVLAVIGVTLMVVALRTRRAIKNLNH
jgi:hypothetical protein